MKLKGNTNEQGMFWNQQIWAGCQSIASMYGCLTLLSNLDVSSVL